MKVTYTLHGGGECPEQYNVVFGKSYVGYLRLRHGTFRADVPDVGGRTVYVAHPKGVGCFEPEERMHYLTQAMMAIHRHYAGSNSASDGRVRLITDRLD